MSSIGSEATISNRVQALAAPLSGWTCSLLGAAVLVGWACDVTVVKCVIPGMVAMKPNAAIGFVLLGILLLGYRSQRREQRIFNALVATALVALSVATLVEYALGCNLGIDELLFRDNEIEPAGLFQPGRMSPIAAASFILLAAATLQLRSTGGWMRWASWW